MDVSRDPDTEPGDTFGGNPILARAFQCARASSRGQEMAHPGQLNHPSAAKRDCGLNGGGLL